MGAVPQPSRVVVVVVTGRDGGVLVPLARLDLASARVALAKGPGPPDDGEDGHGSALRLERLDDLGQGFDLVKAEVVQRPQFDRVLTEDGHCRRVTAVKIRVPACPFRHLVHVRDGVAQFLGAAVYPFGTVLALIVKVCGYLIGGGAAGVELRAELSPQRCEVGGTHAMPCNSQSSHSPSGPGCRLSCSPRGHCEGR